MLKCLAPYIPPKIGLPVGCGKCFFCNIKKKSKWTARLMMELHDHTHAVFLTLTFSDEHLPNPPYVSKRDLQLFFKRLRKNIAPRKIRYYACAEYGSERGRPHYHAIVFNLRFSDADAVASAWPFGFFRMDAVVAGSIAYVAGYVSKKFIGCREYQFTGEVKEKEFNLMSRRPALGSGFIKKLLPYAFSQSPCDVIDFLSIGGRRYYLDKTLKDKLRKMVMTDEEITKIKELRKENYALSVAEEIAENFSEGSAQEFLEAFQKMDRPSVIERVYYNYHFAVLAPSLKQEASVREKKIYRKDL